jgi:hypothetical protein
MQVQVVLLGAALAIWPEGEDDSIIQQLLQRRDVSGQLCRLEVTLGIAQLIRARVPGYDASSPN